MTGREFRALHGDPADWDDDEYDTYFALTADQTTPGDYQPAA
ncbi:hypothetical protein ACTWJ9_33655 (plasmid) [Streptomyces sp. GDS52]